MEFNQIKTGKDNYTIISEDTISKIACIKAFDAATMNKMLHDHHKYLLRYAKNKNEHKEVGLFWDLNNVEAEPLKIKGQINGFNIHDVPEISALVKNPHNILSVVIMHNHPRNGWFSGADIRSFIDFNSIYLMTAVCNDGTIYMLRKERNFNPLLMEKYYNDGVKLSEDAVKKERLKKAKRLKLDINKVEDRTKINQLSTKPYYYGIQNIAKHAKEIGVTFRCSVARK